MLVMKKTMLILILVISANIVWYSGCVPCEDAKDCINNQGRAYNFSPEEEKVLEKIQKASQEAKQSVSQSKTTIVSPANNSNPYEYVGITHNNILDTFASKFSTIVDSSVPVSFTLPDGTILTGNSRNEKLAVYTVKYSYNINNPINYNSLLNYVSYFDRNTAPDNNYIDNMMVVFQNTGYTAFQTNVLKIYFKTLLLLNDNVNSAITFSVATENIINNSSLSDATKEKILVAVTTAIYSTYYWQKDTENNGTWNQNSSYRINWFKAIMGGVLDGLGAGAGCAVCVAACPPCAALTGGFASAVAWVV